MKTIKFNPEGKTLFEAYGFENPEQALDAFSDKHAKTIKEMCEDPSDDINEVELAKTILSRYTDEEILMMATKQVISEYEDFAQRIAIIDTLKESLKKKLNT